MSALLALDGVTVARGGRTVLAGADLQLHAGERLALVGPNGAGKTTLLRTLVGLERPSAGRVVAFGAERRTEVDFGTVRARAQLMFQDPDDQLFCPTVIDDVAFGPLNLGRKRDEAFAAARAVLERLGLVHLADRVTHRLSGGEKRLVCLAALIAMAPDALLLDEPTNDLDEENRARMIDILLRLDAALLLVSHDRDFLERIATRAVLLREGTVRPALVHRHVVTQEEIHIHGLDASHRHAEG
ncbi:energy-coupling factor ABC transporter ATP-binding protein [Xanthobacter tagetidis]|uniref:ABC transporter ATP-binding protein n=1 Tax=Xanthobacter tagetidis TaxID=60216 RepID=A0A3L7AKV1_9HYPH|nr:ABC transporter ATP-binding protein [Xanthobacter tagetidis]MBB6307587.1 cobalt/nickel transport system ATP-binding protein [Xanthobacter tagetidis]RLP81156.1 ABC transporter ATP-binding protein [Xanthobacter tagetidis]